MSKTISIARDKRYPRNMTLFSILLLALSGRRLWHQLQDGDSVFMLNVWIILSIAMLWMLISNLRRWLDSRPALLLTQDHLTDHASLLAVGDIPWSEVRSAEVKKYAGEKQLIISVDRAKDYLKGQTYFKRKMAEQMITDEGTPIVINTRFVQRNPQKVADMINHKVRTRRLKEIV